MFLAFKTAIQAISNISAQEFLDFMTSSCYFWCFKREVNIEFIDIQTGEKISCLFLKNIFIFLQKYFLFIDPSQDWSDDWKLELCVKYFLPQ